MERGNSKHGPRLDEEMADEVRGLVQGALTDARVQEWREPEPAGEDQPGATAIPEGERPGGAPGPMTANEVAERSELGTYIPMSALPGDREDLLAAAEEMDAPDHVLDELQRLPAEQHFETVSQAWTALGHHSEQQRW